MKYKKSAALLSLALIPAAITALPETEVKAQQSNEKFAYYMFYDGRTFDTKVAYVDYLISKIVYSTSSYNYELQIAYQEYQRLTDFEKYNLTNEALLLSYLNSNTNVTVDNENIATTFTKKMSAISLQNRNFIRDVEEANRYYSSLTSTQKAWVAQHLVVQLQRYIDGVANLRAVEAKLVALDPYAVNYYYQYQEAMQAYNLLPADYRAFLSVQAREKIQQYEEHSSSNYNQSTAQGVITAISKLTTVSKPAEVQAVRELYNNLTVYQQSFVTNSKDLIYIEDILKNPHLGWDPEFYDYNAEPVETIPTTTEITRKGNGYLIQMPISDMKRYTPTSITVSNNISLTINRLAIPNGTDGAVVAMSVEELAGESIAFFASLYNEDIHFTDYIEIEVDGLPSNAVILQKDINGEHVAVPYRKQFNTYVIKTKSSGEFFISTNTAQSFHDIRTDGHRMQIEELAKRKIVNGVSRFNYEPRANVTLAQYSAMIARSMGLTSNEASPYLDVQSQWFESSVQALHEAGILDEVNGSYFDPNQIVTRQQAATIAIRMLAHAGISLYEPAYEDVPFTDFSQIPVKDRANVALAYSYGIFGGKDDGTFDPNAQLTRSQMAKVLYRTLQIAKLI